MGKGSNCQVTERGSTALTIGVITVVLDGLVVDAKFGDDAGRTGISTGTPSTAAGRKYWNYDKPKASRGLCSSTMDPSAAVANDSRFISVPTVQFVGTHEQRVGGLETTAATVHWYAIAVLVVSNTTFCAQ